MTRVGLRILSLLTALLVAAPAFAQLQLATIRGRMIDTGGVVIPAVTIELTDPLGGLIVVSATDHDGRFVFTNIALGRYGIRSTVAGFEPLTHPIEVTSALPIEVTLRMALRTATAMTIGADAAPDTPATVASIAGASLSRVPVRSIARGVQEAVATLPGWATEDNGLLHVRGTDDGFLYVLDGVPVYERLDQVSSLGPDLTTVESITVRTGYIPAEFGYKAGGVIDVRSKANSTNWRSAFEIDRGSDHTTNASVFTGGPVGATPLSFAVGASGQRSDRYLDPIHPDNLHNSGSTSSISSHVKWVRPDADIVSAAFGRGGSTFDVPNSAAQEEAGQRQRQRLAQTNASINWQRVWRSETLSQVAVYLRRSSSDLDGSEFDTPLFANAARTLQRAGMIAGFTRRLGSSTVKAGIEAQRLHLEEDFRFVGTASTTPLVFDFEERATPWLWAGFVQTDWQATAALMISAGLRYDDSRLLLARRQVSPRTGLAYRIANDTVVRGSVSRFFQPPQPENLLLASSEEARVLSPLADDGEDGGAEVEPERQWGFEAGINHRVLPFLRLDVAGWYCAVRNAADPNVFAGTTIIFPNVVAAGRARGLDARLELSDDQWSGYLNAAIGSVKQNGPIVGGLFLEDEVAELSDGVEFVPDHDQRLVLSSGLAWQHRRSRADVSATVRYESGTPIQREQEDQDELQERPGAELVDFERGRVKPRTIVSLQAVWPLFKRDRRTIEVQASLLNALDARYAYNFGNPFSGTHFGAPRTAALGLRLRF